MQINHKLIRVKRTVRRGKGKGKKCSPHTHRGRGGMKRVKRIKRIKRLPVQRAQSTEHSAQCTAES